MKKKVVVTDRSVTLFYYMFLMAIIALALIS